MTDTPEEIKAKARALRNKPSKKPSFGGGDQFSGNKGSKISGSQTTPKSARKPSV